MNKSTRWTSLGLALVIVAILAISLLWSEHWRPASSTFSSILPTPKQPTPTSQVGGTPSPTSTSAIRPTVPPSTVVFPTPPTPASRAPVINQDQAIGIALNQNAIFAEMKQRGELTATAKLTVHGDAQAGTTGDLRIHPQLPVWMVYVHLPAWKEMRGPVGKQVEVQFDTERYEIDATTGSVIGGGRSYMGGEKTITATPAALP